MRVVITGGTGLIGRPLVSTLVADSHEIVILSRDPAKYAGSVPGGVAIVQWDAKTSGDWVTYLDGADVVINFAGENLAGESFLPNRWTDEKKRRIRESRINAGKAIVEAVKEVDTKPKLLIQSSAVGYYGPSGDEIITESNPPGDDFLALLCIEWEASTAEVESLGLRRIIVRTGLVLTTEGGPLKRLIFPFKMYAGMYFGDGKQWWPWIHIEDELWALRFLMEHDSAAGPFNLTASNPVTNREFGRTLGRVMGKPSFLPAPRFALNMMLGEVSTVVTDGQRAVPKKLEELGFTFRYQRLEPALRDLLVTRGSTKVLLE